MGSLNDQLPLFILDTCNTIFLFFPLKSVFFFFLSAVFQYLNIYQEKVLKWNVSVWQEMVIEDLVPKYLHWPSEAVCQTRVPLNANTHTTVPASGTSIHHYLLCDLVSVGSACCLFFCPCCSVWLHDKNQQIVEQLCSNPECSVTCLYLYWTEDSNFYWVKLKHKSSFWSEIIRFNGLIIIWMRLMLWGGAEFTTVVTSGIKTTAQWSLYFKYLELQVLQNVFMVFVFIYVM